MGQPASEDSNIAVERIMQDFISTETSQTAMACEQAALFGATPGPEEFDNREIWNEYEALAGIEEAIHILAGAVAPDGTQLWRPALPQVPPEHRADGGNSDGA